MVRKRFIATALCLILASTGAAFGLDLEGEKAYAALKTAPFFAIGGVGYAGQTSEGEKALRVLLRQPEAASLFKALLHDKNASAAGRLYALFGLRRVDLEVFSQEAKPLLADQTKVSTMSGCVLRGGGESVAAVARRIQKSQYVSRGRTLFLLRPSHRRIRKGQSR